MITLLNSGPCFIPTEKSNAFIELITKNKYIMAKILRQKICKILYKH